MSEKLTIERKFHVTTCRRGHKRLQKGKAPASSAGRIPRIVRLLALAHHCRNLIRSGVIINQAELAHYGQITTTRMTQIMWLDNLAPDIQEEILNLPRKQRGRDLILEKHVRPIAKTHDWNEQRKLWEKLKKRTATKQ